MITKPATTAPLCLLTQADILELSISELKERSDQVLDCNRVWEHVVRTRKSSGIDEEPTSRVTLCTDHQSYQRYIRRKQQQEYRNEEEQQDIDIEEEHSSQGELLPPSDWDATVEIQENSIHSTVNTKGLPYLDLPSLFRVYHCLKSKVECSDLKSEEKLVLCERLESDQQELLELKKGIQMRYGLLQEVVSQTALHQQDFLQKGWEFLRPLKLADVATELNKDPSVISRTVKNKTVLTPQGLAPLRHLFSMAPICDPAFPFADRALAATVCRVLKFESWDKPFSDEEIRARVRERRDIDLPRRSVATLRSKLGIPCSKARLRIYRERKYREIAKLGSFLCREFEVVDS